MVDNDALLTGNIKLELFGILEKKKGAQKLWNLNDRKYL